MSRCRWVRSLAVTASVVLPALIWLVAVPLAGCDLRVADPSGRPPLRVGLGAVVVVAVMVAVAGWGSLALLERFTHVARAMWLVAALSVFLVSFLPLTGSAAAPSTRVVLGLMHVAVAVALIPAMAVTSPGGRRGRSVTAQESETASC
ncbi:DUF6069 family protein [Micromonospora sp. NPDC050495]|uniref:DUF6069 family protein n=1 Tax=Micromonospora sp. NPDC050495 TaxID=3154936 RepID=UPI0033C5ECE5